MEDVEKWKKAGKIAAEALKYGVSLVKNGANIREVCDKIDEKIIELGALPAWPTQVGLDSVAAHSTPDHDDNTLFNNNLVCLDVGAQIDGCVGDNAASVDLSGKYENLMNASKDALDAAIKTVKIGAKLSDIGKAIQEAIEKHGAVPVRNLSGHGISPYVIHDSPSIPNFDNGDGTELHDGQIIAIEPFATNGAGLVQEAEQGNLFSVVNVKPVRSAYSREILAFINENYKNLPFTTRWLIKKFGVGKTNFALNELMRAGILHAYPPLIEKNKGMVAVFEHTILVKDQPEVLTKL